MEVMKKLIDQYARNINYLRISVTDRCNLKCIYCLPNSNIIYKHHKEILTYEEILKIVQVSVSLGINKIRITGGEPLVRENIVYLIGALSEIKGIDDLSLTTNGILLDEYVKDLKKVGLKRINISLDTLKREKYKFITGVDGLSKVLESINKSLKIGLNPVKINIVVMKGINEDEIVEFAKLSFKEPLHLRFIELMPLNMTIQDWEKKFIPNNKVKDYCQNLGELEEVGNISYGSTSLNYRYRNAKGTISFISPISSPFCSKCSRLRVTSCGKLRLCLGSPEEIDLISIIRNNQFSFDALRQAFILAVNSKPGSHRFNHLTFSVITNENEAISFLKRDLSMCQIGG
jgi:cyclic pyranopterin phosphate synthase